MDVGTKEPSIKPDIAAAEVAKHGLAGTREALASGDRGRAVAAIPENDRHVLFERLIDNDGAVAPVSIDPLRDIAVLQYTGGTTGSPKAARLTHANLYINTEQLALWAPETRPGLEKSLAVLPLFH